MMAILIYTMASALVWGWELRLGKKTKCEINHFTCRDATWYATSSLVRNIGIIATSSKGNQYYLVFNSFSCYPKPSWLDICLHGIINKPRKK